MSLCFDYDFQKWTILSLGLVAASLLVGLVLMQVGHGETNLGEMQTILGYCFLHADRPNPVQDLVDKGLVSANFTGQTCGSVKQTYDEESKKQQLAESQESERKLAFTKNCMFGNLTPSQQMECFHAGVLGDGPVCLYDEEDVFHWYDESEWNSGRYKLTPEELSECKDKGYLGSGTWANYGFSEEDEGKDKDGKNNDK